METNDNSRLQAALAFAEEKHRGQTRMGGDAYITHPMAAAALVKEWGYDVNYQIAALFHDLLEDTDAKEEDLLALGGAEVLAAVRLVTKEKGYVMADYIARIAKNPMARVIKAADRLHNLRCAFAAPEAFRIRYIRESMEWYLAFSPHILPAVLDLNASLAEPLEL